MMKTSEVFLEAFRNLEVKSLPLCENKNILNTKDTKVTKGKPLFFIRTTSCTLCPSWLNLFGLSELG